MGNKFSLQKNKEIFNSLVFEYETLKSKYTPKDQLFSKILEKYNYLTSKCMPTLDLLDIDLSCVDGIIKTDTFTLIGWNDDNEDIDLVSLEEILKNGIERDSL